MRVAAIQMVSGLARDANLARARGLLERAAREEADLAVLPEFFCLLGRADTDKLEIREQAGSGPVQDFLASTAQELGLWIVGGTLPLDAEPDPQGSPLAYNSTLVYAPHGGCVARYDKIHLFHFDNGKERYDEARTLRPGQRPVTFELDSRDGHRWRLGLSVCYDLRFPELYRGYARAGVDLLLAPSAFTHTTGQAHWEPLLRARAIENLAYVVAAAQGGVHENGRRTWGHTMLIDPWGRVLKEQPEDEAVLVADFDAQWLRQCRQQLPVLEWRAP